VTNLEMVKEVRGSIWDQDDMEPRVRTILDRKIVLRETGPYTVKSDEEISAIIRGVYACRGYNDVSVTDIRRMAGGASKEQFAFTLHHQTNKDGKRFVLRMDPLESIAQTCRGREAQVLKAIRGTLPVPEVEFCDPDGDISGQPLVITSFVDGVTKPTDIDARGVSGIGLRYDSWAPKLAPQFIDTLCKIHHFDWKQADLSYFNAPEPGTKQAALHQINWWSLVWRQDMVEPVPVITFTERWLRENAPVCDSPVLVHADFRIGNFMFEEPSGKFTAVLDWELSHIGDFHEDIAWATQRLFGTWRDDGEFLVCGLLPRKEFIEQYEASSGNKIDRNKLHYYEVLNAYKCAVMGLGVSMRVAKHGNNHQDLLLTWIGSAGAVFLNQMVKLIREQ